LDDEFFGGRLPGARWIWRRLFAFDSKVIDGGVNGSAWLTRCPAASPEGRTRSGYGLVNAIAASGRLMSPLVRALANGSSLRIRAGHGDRLARRSPLYLVKIL